MSHVGHSRRFRDIRVTSVLPPKADIHRKDRHVSNVPKAEERRPRAVSTMHCVGRYTRRGSFDHAITELTPPSFEKIFRPRTFGGKVALRVKALRKNILHTKGIKVEADGKGDFIYLVRLLFLSLDSHHQHLGGLPLQTVPQTDNESK